MLLVHGALSDREHAFGAVRPLLERRCNVYALDRRGHGDSDDTDTYDARSESADVLAVLEALPGPVDLIGHSFGALCALEAARAGAEIRRLVLYEGVPRDGRTICPDGLPERVEVLLRAGEQEAALDAVLEEVEHHGPAQLARDHRAPSWSSSVAGIAVLHRELELENHYRFVPERYEDLTAPTLVLAGAESADSVRADAEAVAAGLPDAGLTLLAGQRHACLHRAPELFASTVLDFLSRPRPP